MPASTNPLTSKLRSRLRAEFPFLRAGDLAAAERLGEGWCTTAYRVGNLAVRVPKSETCAAPLALEPRLVPALEAAGVPFAPRGMRAVLDAEGRLLATAHEYVAGEPARHVRPLPRGAARDALARDLGRFLGRLHGFPATDARRLGAPERDLWPDQYVPLIAAARPYLGARTRQWLDGLCATFLDAGGSSHAPRVLVHGDVDGRNVLLDDGGKLSGVIDYSDAMLADPALDFACILNDWSWAFLERVLAHYPIEVDADLRRRTAFYITIGPLFEVRQGVATGDLVMLRRGRAALARRAAAGRGVEPSPRGP
ncbi:MAG: aminoglycoside phosphotransferase family protein [Dehalococcoidia bacterium]